jgi:hypothetical protein
MQARPDIQMAVYRVVLFSLRSFYTVHQPDDAHLRVLGRVLTCIQQMTRMVAEHQFRECLAVAAERLEPLLVTV